MKRIRLSCTINLFVCICFSYFFEFAFCEIDCALYENENNIFSENLQSNQLW